jgi:ribosome recycling factor
MKRFFDQMQDVTDSFIKRLNANQEAKEKEILDN